MVTHSYLAAAAMDRILFIRDGRIVDEVDVAGAARREARAKLQVVRATPPDAE
jgi:ABC-type transport system involved in cytochrome bd biosynthesis fused ATPase/permease subunit